MTRKHAHKQDKTSPAIAVILAVVIALSVPGQAQANEASANWAERGSMEIQGSYFMGRRETFRDIYGTGVAFGIWYRRNIADKIAVGIKLSGIQLSGNHGEVFLSPDEVDTNKVTHRDFAASSTITYELYRTNSMRLFGGGGLGFSFRTIIFDSRWPDDPGDMRSKETSPYGLIILGGDILLTRSVFAGLRFSLDHHFFGDPQMGDFGDTGGFSFGGSIGIGF